MHSDFGIKDHDTASKSASIKSPMPCTVAKVFVKPGQEVKKGDNLIALEAMKMEHLIKSGREGKIKAVYGAEGKFVDANTILIEYEE